MERTEPTKLPIIRVVIDKIDGPETVYVCDGHWPRLRSKRIITAAHVITNEPCALCAEVSK